MNELAPTIVHLGMIVRDLQKSIDFFSTMPGIKFTEFYETTFKREWVNGVETPAGSIRVAKMYIGDVGLEIIQPLSEVPYQAKVLREKGEGLHHIALLFKGTAGEVEKNLRDKGYEPIWSCELMDGRIAHYFGTEKDGGLVVEVMNDWPRTWPNPHSEGAE